MQRVLLTLVALTVLLPSVALARTRFLCDVDLLVRDSCCCPPKKAAPAGDAATMKRECCRFVRHSAAAAPAATVAGARSTIAPVATPVATAMVLPSLRELRATIVPRAQAPPLERSLLAQHCALLV